MLNDSHLITPKEPKIGECESCQCIRPTRDLVEVKVFKNYQALCDSCANATLEFLGGEDE